MADIFYGNDAYFLNELLAGTFGKWDTVQIGPGVNVIPPLNRLELLDGLMRKLEALRQDWEANPVEPQEQEVFDITLWARNKEARERND